jgi:hypothetical protein
MERSSFEPGLFKSTAINYVKMYYIYDLIGTENS